MRLALRTKAWFPVVTSQLAGNAITLIMPGGAAVGAAVQFRMLATSGKDTSSTVGGLTAFSLLGVGGLLALPVFALPVILVGAPTNRGLVNAAILGAVGFVAFAALGAVVLAYDAPLRWCGRAAQQARNWVLRKRPPLTGLDETLLFQRNEIRAALGEQWWQALLLSAGRLAVDYLCLLAALRATGARPRPSLILVAYAVASVVGMIPATPGGLGLVEASLTGLLVLAEVNSSQAVLATLTYRLASYWAPLCAGPIAYGPFRLRYRSHPAAARSVSDARHPGSPIPAGVPPVLGSGKQVMKGRRLTHERPPPGTGDDQDEHVPAGTGADAGQAGCSGGRRAAGRGVRQRGRVNGRRNAGEQRVNHGDGDRVSRWFCGIVPDQWVRTCRVPVGRGQHEQIHLLGGVRRGLASGDDQGQHDRSRRRENR